MPPSALTPTSASRIERKRERNRRALLAAARRLFVRDGFESTTIAAIAEEADLGFGTFYRYFPDKEAILSAVFEEGRAEIVAVLDELNLEGTAVAALRRFNARLVPRLLASSDVLRLMWESALRDTKRHREVVRPPEASLPALLADAATRIISRGTETREFLAGDLALRARFFSSAYLSLLAPIPSGVREDALVREVDEFTLRALGAGIDSTPTEGP